MSTFAAHLLWSRKKSAQRLAFSSSKYHARHKHLKYHLTLPLVYTFLTELRVAVKPWQSAGYIEVVVVFVKVIYTYRLFWIPVQLTSFLLHIYWIFLYMKTASKDYLIFKKQPVMIIRRIKVSIKDKSILCTDNVNME